MKLFKDIPIFPLKSIILPGGQFPLRIFERRYLDMTRNCLKHNTGFVIALTKKIRITSHQSMIMLAMLKL